MSDQALFLAQFALDTPLHLTITNVNLGTEVITGPLKMANAWGLTVDTGTRPKPTFYPWHRVYKVEKA